MILTNYVLVWDKKPQTPGEPINWVELKTSAEIRGSNDQFKFDRKLMRYWIQSFLLGVPKIIVGFRNMDGILTHVEELKTISIPDEVQRRGMARWDGNVCIKFTSLFLECRLCSPFYLIHDCPSHSLANLMVIGLRTSLNDEGVWRIRRPHKANYIELFKVEEVGHGNLITDDFMNWRIKLSLSKDRPPDAQEPAAAAEAPLDEEEATARE